MVKQAFKKKYLYSNQEKYRLFLKRKFTTLTPNWYSVSSYTEVLTVDGPMFAVEIIQNEIENPSYEPIAEVWINDEYVYLWREHCWTVAVDKNNKPICKLPKGEPWWEIFGPNQFTLPPRACHKILLIHRIGHLTVE